VLPVVSGLLLALSLPPFPFGPLAFVALVPLTIHVCELPADPQGRRASLRAGLWTGAVFFAALVWWIPFSLPGRPWMGAAYWVASVAVLALFPALAARLLHDGLRRAHLPLWLALPLAWTAAEWLRGAMPGGLAFPWAGLALALVDFPLALGGAAWVGEHGVAFWIALVNGLIAGAVLEARRSKGRVQAATDGVVGLGAGTPSRAARRPVVASILVATLPPGLLSLRAAAASDAETHVLRVAVIQTAIPQTLRENPEGGARAMSEALGRLLPAVAAGAADLVVLPETAFPVALEAALARGYLDSLREHSRRLRAPIVVGALGTAEAVSSDGRAVVYNSVFVVDSSGVRGRYDKRHLVPGVERAPFLPASVAAALGDTAAYGVGQPAPLPVRAAVGDLEIGPLVCFETAFGPLARGHARAGARLLVNVTNDAWFGATLAGPAARAQHEAHAVLRAVESGLPVVRAANGGVSMWVSPVGRARRVAEAGQEASGLYAISLPDSAAPARWLGEVLGPLSALAGLLLLASPGARRRPPRGTLAERPKALG
jgi:apolipoprotein N-acyltransferase